jgi:Ca2+-binding RTX toxin-like protein
MRGDVFPNFDKARRLRRFGPRPEGRRAPAIPQPVETLEKRVHLSFSASPDTGLNILTLTGDGNGDTVLIYESDATPYDQLTVKVNGSVLNTWNLDADLTKVKVLAGGGADDVEFGTNFWGWLGGDEDVSIQAVVYGGDGNDTIISTDQPDTVWGDNGDDEIWAEDGNDILYGYGGADTLQGRDGDDLMYGCDGLNGTDSGDSMVPGNGNDTVYGEGGNDLIFTNGGNDQCYGGDGNDQLNANGGSCYLGGGNGNDTFYAQDGGVTNIKGDAGTDSIGAYDSNMDPLLDTIELF